ncbi:MAG: hypothetical protein ACRBB0_04900 [Pelagimonas sp.]|uniref:hypothetical protein n=1 Tax=Pelagimonas sp. TaxID=2073170 RepID=UPI003D6B38CF
MKPFFLFAATVVLSACQISAPEDLPKTNNPDALIGRTILHEDGNLAVNPDGSIGGDLTGTWEIKNTRWCRTIATPEKYAGTECRDVHVSGNSAFFTRDNGVSYTMKLK